MRTLIYVPERQQNEFVPLMRQLRAGKDTAIIGIIERWEGEIESVNVVMTDDERIKSAYLAAGVKVISLKKEEPKKREVKREVKKKEVVEPVKVEEVVTEAVSEALPVLDGDDWV